MSEESISNFPPTQQIFEEPKTKNNRKKKSELSAISRAELIGGFQPTTEEIIESSRAHNPFDFPASRKSSKTANSYYSTEISQFVYKATPSTDTFVRKKNELTSFIMSERTRLLYQDPQEYLCAHTRNELNAAKGFPIKGIRKQMFHLGLL